MFFLTIFKVHFNLWLNDKNFHTFAPRLRFHIETDTQQYCAVWENKKNKKRLHCEQ